MEQIKAPEKLYFNTGDIYGILDIYSSKESNDDIEYVRKDTFIKKACEWLSDNRDHPFIGCEDHHLSGFLTDEFIEEFRKEMEG